MENTIEQIQSLVNELNLQNTPLMEKPSARELLVVTIGYEKGKFIKTRVEKYSDPTYWCYPAGVEEKIEDDKTYKFWGEYRDSADPYDSTSWYHVKYIEEVPKDKITLINFLRKLLNELK